SDTFRIRSSCHFVRLRRSSSLPHLVPERPNLVREAADSLSQRPADVSRPERMRKYGSMRAARYTAATQAGGGGGLLVGRILAGGSLGLLLAIIWTAWLMWSR